MLIEAGIGGLSALTITQQALPTSVPGAVLTHDLPTFTFGTMVHISHGLTLAVRKAREDNNFSNLA